MGTKPRNTTTYATMAYQSQSNKQMATNTTRPQQMQVTNPDIPNLQTHPQISPNQVTTPEKKLFEHENILIGDSNIRFDSAGCFPAPIAKIDCPTLQKLPEILQTIKIPNAKNILPHLGTNDFETATEQDFQKYLTFALKTVAENFSNANIHISSILQRSDHQHLKVQTANNILKKSCTINQ